ncbi:winged helix-turn-helix transcriptional regulator [Rhodococcus spelaei]|uniref:Winged helix-turn-helix transcriptional regulator n=1 Tax=Rhodococcus spelaei TaxID=2546320 RepID=A0A541BLT3_9NOCA|nr:MarR family winged helix-turn-helix transcriptional regulator [Rhodococcus spelaei]TQF73293.1 winged helix-turn-helix transcriptional regulator [Rhodococcus spelaei]
MVSPETATNLIDILRGLVRQARGVAVRSQHLGMLPPPLGALLGNVECSQGHRPSVLAEELRVTQSALSRQVSHAEALGYVQRTPDPLDRRATLLSLTESGAEALRIHREAQLDWLRTAIADWSEEEVADLAGRLDRLRSALDAEPVPLTAAY